MKTRRIHLQMFLGFLLLMAAWPAGAQVSLISTGAVWKYLDTGADQGTGWRASAFADDTWASGPAQLGYGDGDEATMNGFGPDSNNKYITTYYRNTFNVADASSITNLRARLLRDDGAVVYLNGTEVFRSNMPDGDILFSTLAATTATDDGTVFFPSPVSPLLLVNGNNVIAVEVHQSAANSSDISFDFELTGNPLPSISISSPTNTQVIAAANVTINGTAVPGGSSITLVEAFAGATKVGESTSGNFSILWQSVTPGNYALTAKITDSSGLTATTPPVNITVQAPPTGLLVPRHSTWKYNNLNVDLGTDWVQPGYDDSAWLGPLPGPLGDNLEGAVQLCTSVINIGPAATRYPVIYYRRSFSVSSASSYGSLILRLNRDDAAVVYLNGIEILNDGVPEPPTFNYTAGTAAGGADETTYFTYTVPTTGLVDGNNVLAVANYQANAASSDLQFDLEVEGGIDLTAPVINLISPGPGVIVDHLTSINVIFSEGVIGVDAGDLRINGEPATSVVMNNPNDYTFSFPTPAVGVVQVAWSATHGITDTSLSANPFAGGSWSYTFDPEAGSRINVIISEFLADNSHGISDEDGSHSDWIELYNLGPNAFNLDGWFLTDTATNLTQWRIPAVPMAANSYLLVFASGKDRANLGSPLHTNFKLSKSAGSYLALVNPTTNVVSAFSNYVAQSTDVSYGHDRVDPSLIGFFTTPTPGKANSTSGSGFTVAPILSPPTGVYTNSVTLVISNAPGTTVRYTLNGSAPTSTSTLYTGPVVLSNSGPVKARAFPAAPGLFPSDIVSVNFVFLDDSSKDFNSNLPLLIISTEGQGIPANVVSGGNRTEGTFAVINTPLGRSSLQTEPDFIGSAGFEIFGQTSVGFPKQPLRIEIHDAFGNDLKEPLLGMPADSDWKLRNPFDDKTLLNDYLGFNLWERMGHYGVRSRLVEVFVDTGGGPLSYPADYYGVMVLTETIKVGNDRVDIKEITPYATNAPDITGGYIFKKDKDSDGDLNFGTAGGPGQTTQGLKLHEPKPQSMRLSPSTAITTFPGAGYTPSGSKQLAYLQGYINAMERAMYTNTWLAQTGTNHYSYYMDLERFADFQLLVEFTKQIDGYRLSSYFSKDRNGKVGPGPVWDWNLSFGNANYLQGGTTNGWYYEELSDTDHIWLRRLITGGTNNATASAGDPDFTQRVADRWAVLRTNVLNGTNMVQEIDNLSIMLNDAANRDLFGKYRASIAGVYQWPNPDGTGVDGRDVDYVHPLNYIGTTTGSIIGQMKKWMLGRYIWMDSQFTKPPDLSASDQQVTNGFTVTITPPPGATLYYTLNGVDPRAPGGSPAAGAVLASGPVTITVNSNIRIVARAKAALAWKGTWSGPVAATFFTTIPPLRITEIMYHPAPPPLGSTNSAEDFEFIEVKNISALPLDVTGFSLNGGVQFQFPAGVILAAGQSAVIVANTNAFQSRYGGSLLVLGTYTGNLNNNGDHLVLDGPLLEDILDFSYQDGWYPVTDGFGFSLVTLDENAPTSAWGSSANWRASSAIGGSPGIADPAPPPRPAVVVNEALAKEDLTADDAIELRNTTAGLVNIGGWFLTDDFNDPKKYIIPPNTILPPGGYIVFHATNSFATNGIYSFALGANGDQVYLFSGNGVDLTGYAHGFDFGASANNVTFGRYVTSTGADHFVAQVANTLGSANSAPLVGPVVVSEIQYHPADIASGNVGFDDAQDEFIELHNFSNSSVPLYDAAYPSNTWHLRDAVSFDFPTNVVLPAGGYLLVVGFDPLGNPGQLASFRARNFVPGGLPVFGPWNGKLDNAGAKLELSKPEPNPTNAPYVLVERVGYSDTAPWPAGADGLGLSLQRLVPSSYANDPTNWVASAPTPGGGFIGGTAPLITSQPGDQLVLATSNATFTVTATGTGPLRYQWRFNGLNITDATNSTLSYPSFQFTQAGLYTVFVYNGAGYALGTNFNVSSRIVLHVTAPPQNRFALIGQSTNFTIAVQGTGTLLYRWQLNGVNLLGATAPTYQISAVSSNSVGTYTCRVSDDYDTIVSDPVTLTLIFKPATILQPLSQTVVEGTTASYSIAASGTLPINFRWRTNGVFIGGPNVNVINSGNGSVLVINNMPTNYNGLRLTVQMTNMAGLGPLSANATNTVLLDSDHDGLPDVWETAHGLNPNSPLDGLRDDDGDGMSNAAEYLAGTDYLDASSYLKVQIGATGGHVVQFNAVSNRTYTVQYTDGLNPPNWTKLTDKFARGTNRIELVPDPLPPTNRFYRLVIPAQP